MPNGGIDNCFTCWFNTRNRGEVNHAHVAHDGDNYCSIRQLKIEGEPAYTYCANSPYNSSEDFRPDGKIQVPVGGVYKHSDDSPRRVLWQPAPDSEEIRQGLLALLEKIEETPVLYAGGAEMSWDDMVIFQLGEYREQRAVEGLKRIAGFDPEAASPDGQRSRRRTVALAEEALKKISDPGDDPAPI